MKAALTGMLAAIVLLAASACSTASADANPRITIHRSHFTPGRITVPDGVPVTIALRNDDPIEHEWIVGDEATHERHRTGAEPHHDSIPTEVTVPAYTTKTTTITFDKPGEYVFICHLPGHEAYGMRGVVRVVGK